MGRHRIHESDTARVRSYRARLTAEARSARSTIEQLHERIAELEAQVRDLEARLAVVEAN
jgi:hypothetical protein